MPTRLAVLGLAAALLASGAARAEDAAPSPVAQRPALADPWVLLIRNDSVRDELKLTAEQRRAVEELLAQHNRVLLAIRDVSPSGADETAQPALEQLRNAFRELLDLEQRKRLKGLILQAQGYDSLLREDVAKFLKLSDEQQSQLIAISEEFKQQSRDLREKPEGKSDEQVQLALADLQTARQKRILETLEKEQTKRWAAVLGQPFDFSQVVLSPADVPEFPTAEFANPDLWLNSPPLDMKSLRGRVVVVHFFAFGCSNCIANYPWYREWQDAFDGQDVTIIGIHTPETEGEKSIEQLRLSLEKNGLKFPVAVDQRRTMWQAWYNNMWPSVYLVDRQGRVRFWWYGELNWQDAGGQILARQRIEQLLAEDANDDASAALQSAVR